MADQGSVNNNDTAAPADVTPADNGAAAAPKEPLAGFPGMLAAEKTGTNGGNTTLIYSAAVSDKIVMAHMMATQVFPCSFALCHSKELQKSSYVHLYEDRIEWNFPTSVCMQIVDNPQVLYLDRDVAELQTVPDCCRPACTHCFCAPTCWDLSGEVLMLHGLGTCCFVKGGKISAMALPGGNYDGCPQLLVGRPLPCLNRSWLYIPHLDNANELKFEVRKVRTSLVAAKIAQQLTGSAAAASSSAQARE